MATALASGTNAKQMRENLDNYEAQLQQVEAALTNDPENEELLKLKEDLSEVIKLTQDLVQLAPEPKKKPGVDYEWKPGDACRAVWSGNKKYFNAVIDMVADDGLTCSVTFDGYKTTEIIPMTELRSQGWDEDEAAEESRMRKLTQGPRSSKEKRLEVREYKKKKAQKKAVRMQEIMDFREKEKSRWKNFTQKSSRTSAKAPLDGKQKRSIFAVPDSLSGRVGVGTCNIGGKGMTDFSSPKNYSK